jgi:hypothetical protein
MLLKWFASAPAETFGQELAAFILAELRGSLDKPGAKFEARAAKVLAQVERRVAEHRAREPLNMWKKSRLANAFLWALKDGGCPPAYADQLTEWLTVRL